MNYKKHYDCLIDRAKKRQLNVYKEKHHIVPKCLGGTNEKENIVELTGREHFISHLLLHKIYPNNPSLLRATLMMCVSSGTHNDNRSQNKRYDFLKKEYSRIQSEKFYNGGSPTHNRRWVSNEYETVLIDIEIAQQKIKLGTHISGKKAKRDLCGHLTKTRCEKCQLWVKEATQTRKRKAIKLAQSLYNEFMKSNFKSICEFAKYKKTSQPRLTMLWKKYVKEYVKNKKQGVSFKNNATDAVLVAGPRLIIE